MGLPVGDPCRPNKNVLIRVLLIEGSNVVLVSHFCCTRSSGMVVQERGSKLRGCMQLSNA